MNRTAAAIVVTGAVAIPVLLWRRPKTTTSGTDPARHPDASKHSTDPDISLKGAPFC